MQGARRISRLSDLVSRRPDTVNETDMLEEAFRTAQNRMLEHFGIGAESRFVDLPVVSGQAHVLVSGRGPAVLMLNGIGTPAAMWAPLMAQIEGFTLYGVDLPGYGLTDTGWAVDDAPSYRVAAVRFLKETLSALGLRQAAFVANSLGSLWAIWLALAEPDHVRAMVHIGCPALCLGTSAPLPMRLLSVPWLATVIMKLDPPSLEQVERLSKMVREHPLTPELKELLLATERLPGFESTFLSTLHILLRLQGAHPQMVLSVTELAHIAQPTLLIWGKDDPMGSPAVGESAADAIPDADLVVVEGGHTPWLKQAARLGPLVSAFLCEHSTHPE